AATGPILGSQVQGAGRGRRGSAVALDDQGRQFPRRRGKCIVERSVVPCVNISSRAREFDEYGRRQAGADLWSIGDFGGLFQDLDRHWIEPNLHDRGRLIWSAALENEEIRRYPQVRYLGVGQV